MAIISEYNKDGFIAYIPSGINIEATTKTYEIGSLNYHPKFLISSRIPSGFWKYNGNNARIYYGTNGSFTILGQVAYEILGYFSEDYSSFYIENNLCGYDEVNTSLNKTYFSSYLNSVFIVGGTGTNRGSIATSTDSVTWTLRSISAISEIFCSEYGASTYVVAGSYYNGVGGAALATSTDTITWTTRSLWATASSVVNSIAYGAGVFVAVGQNGANTAISSSTDAITWTTRTMTGITGVPTYGPGNAVIWTGSQFVAGGGISNTYHWIGTSTDGITWTSRSSSNGSSTIGNIGSFSYGNSVYTLTSNTNTGGAYHTSTDTITWTSRNITNNITSAPRFGSIKYVNSLFYGIVDETPGTSAYLAVSTDAITWTPFLFNNSYFPQLSTNYFIKGHNQSIAYGNGKYVLRSTYHSTDTGDTSVYTSSNIYGKTQKSYFLSFRPINEPIITGTA